MPETDTSTDSPPNDKKKDLKKQNTLIAIGALGLVVTFLMFRRMSANSASTTATTASPTDPYGTYAGGYGSGGYTGGSDPTTLAELQAITGDIQSLSTQVSGLTAPVAAPATASGAAVATSGGAATAQINSADFPTQAPASNPWDILGKITDSNNTYSGVNVGGGAPVYANVGPNGSWIQDWSGNLPVGTQIATPAQFSPLVGQKTVTEHIG